MHGIPESLMALAVPIDELHQYHANPRRGDIPAIMDSLSTNGQFRPIFVNVGSLTGRPNEILGGNHTFQAARELEWTHIAATFVDVDDQTARRMVAADNRTNDQAWYDEPELAAMLTLIATDDPTLAGTGFSAGDLADLMAKLQPPDMAALADEFGKPEKSDTWPTLRIQLPRATYNRAMTVLTSYEGEPHEQFAAMLDAATS